MTITNLWCLTLDFTGTSQRTVDFASQQTEVNIDGRSLAQVELGKHFLVLHRLAVRVEVHLLHIGYIEGASDRILFLFEIHVWVKQKFKAF